MTASWAPQLPMLQASPLYNINGIMYRHRNTILDSRSWFCHSTTANYLAMLNSGISFKTSYQTNAREPTLPYYVPVSGRGIDGFILFSMILAQSETQTVSSRIWTVHIESISTDSVLLYERADSEWQQNSFKSIELVD